MSIILELPNTTQERATESIIVANQQETLSEVSETFRRLESLTPEERLQVDNFAKQINLHDSEMITRYGESAQQKLEIFTDGALKGVTGRDVGEIGSLLSEMSTNIQDFNDESDGKFLSIFRPAKRKMEILQVKYSEVSNSLERVKKELLGQRATLLVDIKMLDEMYQQNLDYYKELTMYILAGRRNAQRRTYGVATKS